MRKLLLATVAALGASMGVATYADAQIVDDTDGQSYPTPGTVTVRLNGRFRFYAGVYDANSSRAVTSTAASSTASTSAASAATNTENAGINKISNYGFINYMRLYPGFDGVAANGLKYGASIELRTDNNTAAGGGVFGSPSSLDQRNDPYVRREWGYLGTDRFGTLRLGDSDQPSSLYLTGNFENFDDGGLNGDLPAGFLPGNIVINWPFGDVGNNYATMKAVYLSPQFYGFDFGLSYEPTTQTANGDSTGCAPSPNFGQIVSAGQGVATPGCDNLSSTSTADYARRKNTFEALLRYRGTFGPIGVATTVSYDGSNRVLDSGVGQNTATLTFPNAKHSPLRDLSLGDFGLAVTYGGLTVGGNFQYGQYNVPAGGGYGGLLAAGQSNSQALIVGASYTIGPVIFGAHYLRSFSEGDQQTATNATIFGVPIPTTAVHGGQRYEEGVAAGATYSLAPGIALYASGVWQERRQNGFNFLTGASNNALNNKVSGSVLALGTSFAW